MDTFRSEIRDSVVEALEERVSKGNYQRYLKRLTMKRLRSFTDREVTFDFPVTTLIGPNGGGKTTILGAAGLIYSGTKPRTFFARAASMTAT